MPSKSTDVVRSLDTRLTHGGSHPLENQGFVNPQVVHASTVLFPDVATMLSGKSKYTYGRRGTPTSDALAEAVVNLEGAAGAVLCPSGLNAVSVALLSCLKAGDHLLMIDTVYGPGRQVCDNVLARFGVEVEYYDPALGGAVETLFRANTKAVYTEVPGSLTFEMMDIPAVVEAARRHDVLVLMDNTWATPVFFRPLEHGVDLSIQAATKYVVGHSDAMLGTVAANERTWKALHATHGYMGIHVGPDDVYLGLRGLRTMGVRLRHHMKSALELARWLESHPLVARVRHPGLESDPGHTLWKRDFDGASGLFAFDLKEGFSVEQTHAFVEALSLFGLGYSWGGFESLALPVRLKGQRTATKPGELASVRLHVGLEDVNDLKADLERGFAAIAD
ncbi:cystathionine beta-lyase [Stappia sp. GBMRC 2046]|uniref:Cystathionine beta-lyase n=1 Tax=Stappia sediminis TaxID=2692190 RepID=A0A7X3LSI0_9HYPH|nr:cystathionine beta-lyase [Stappia sediminis]MXN64279.1 cystathionine beta-lyase [Stappia sediminis]